MDDKTRDIQVTNRTKFIRGLHDAAGNYIELAPGQSRPVTFNEGEFASAERTKYFSFGDVAEGGASDDDDETDDLDVSVSELEAIAKREGVTLPTEGTGQNGRVIKRDIQNAIAAARASAAPPAPTTGSTDDLDKSSDADLFDIVAALTGERPADNTDRETLLKLARGEE